jgi:phosphatidate cytidylyltransferase
MVLLVTWYGGLPFQMMAVLAAGLIFREWQTITGSAEAGPIMIAGWVALGVGCGAVLFADLTLALIAGAVLVAGLALWALVTSKGVWVAGGVAYALLPAIALVHIRMAPSGLILVLLLFIIVWSTDIGAYFAGRSIGGPKLMPKVSPKKTWSGFFGGLSAAVIGVLILRYFVAVPTVAVLLVMVLSVLSQGGDLFESWIKRRYGVKDSGQLIPGHGGIMDRADGLIVAAAAFSALLFLDFI